jgi:hypothetical protein
MPTCETHKTFFTLACRECLHHALKQSIQQKKANDQHNRKLLKQKVKNSEPRKKVNPVSEKRKELNKEYAMLRPEYLLNHPTCEVKLIGCEGASVEIHHTYSGSNKVAHLNDISTWKATCAKCHTILHDKLSANKARELGLKI